MASLDFLPFAARSTKTIEPPPLAGWRSDQRPGTTAQQPARQVTPGWKRGPVEQIHVTNQLLRRSKRLVRMDLYKRKADRSAGFTREIETGFRKQFSMHTKRWQRDTATASSVTDIALHPSYQRIIGMGEAALPLIFEQLRQSLDHWFWALHFITSADPVPEEERGDMEAMRQRWLDWGRSAGYIR
jgi:hypothetical protein